MPAATLYAVRWGVGVMDAVKRKMPKELFLPVSLGRTPAQHLDQLGSLRVDDLQVDPVLREAEQSPDRLRVVERLGVGPHQVLLVPVGQP